MLNTLNFARGHAYKNLLKLTRPALLRNASTSAVKILEVGPRDGLQNIASQVPTPIKIELIQRLAETGLKDIEATSFVSPKWVPQLADGAEVMSSIVPMAQEKSINLQVLGPNLKGFENAFKAGAKEVTVFASATEAFSKANQNCSVEEALATAEKVARVALSNNVAVRGVVSCIFSDPYSGSTDPNQVVRVAKRFLEMGCFEVGLGDTLGVGTPRKTKELLDLLLREIPAEKLAGHFHDTYGQAVANVVAAYDMGIRSFDAAVAGLGGCPYARGAKGNLATEDIVYTMENSGIDTGIDLVKLSETGDWISKQFGLPNNSRAGAAIVTKSRSTVEAPKPKDWSSSSQSNPKTTSPSPLTLIKNRTWTEIENTGEIKVDRAGSAVKITLTRPQKGNSQTPAMLAGLTKLYRELAKDRTVFTITITAQGKYFCTGMDFSNETDRTSSEGDFYRKVRDLFAAIEESPQTTIAVVDGPAFGGGVGLTFACDARIVSKKARWTLSEIKLGLQPAVISRFMPREWGFSFSREAMLSGREVTPEELYRIGAVHQVVDDSSKLDETLEAYLDILEQCAPRSGAEIKQLVRLAWKDAGGEQQDKFIEDKFLTMMVPGSEGEHGISQFQKKNKNVDWSGFWAPKSKL
jgi:hydroxymethylglutaryl-CoA lyase